MIDIAREVQAIRREVDEKQIPAGDARVVRLSREYDAGIEEVWDALTSPSRISRWFLPISGDFRIGGRYQLEGNAGGEIVSCDRPNGFKITWAYGETITPEMISEVEVRLTPIGEGRTRFDMEHAAVVPAEGWDQFGPGAVGVGWDGGLLGLSLHLQGGKIDDPIAWQLSDEGRAWSKASSAAWGAANRAAGADEETVARNVATTNSFYAPEPEAVS